MTETAPERIWLPVAHAEDTANQPDAYGEMKPYVSADLLDDAVRAAYLAGFNASGEGWNGEYPFQDHGKLPENDADWVKDRDATLAKLRSKP